MKKLILIGGALASGKSTYANILKTKFNLSVITKDGIKEVLGDNIFASTREENKKLSALSFELFKHLLICNMSSIVLESNFRDHELMELKKLCDELNYEILSLVFDGDDDVLHKRFLDRLHGNRHYVHKSQDFTNIEDFAAALNELRDASYFGKIINVNCNDFAYQNDEILFKEIEEFLLK